MPIGCPFEVAAAPTKTARVTYNRDIAPILLSRCGSCHRPGEAVPFSLLTYDDAVKHAAQIANVTTRRIMPPWKPEPSFGQFREAGNLTETQIALMGEWVAAMPACIWMCPVPRGNSKQPTPTSVMPAVPVCSWLPGMRPQRLPPGYGQLLRKQSDLVMEIHYQPSGKPEVDRSCIGLHFAPPRR